VIGFNGGANPIDEKMYYNRRAEVWGEARRREHLFQMIPSWRLT
jgi:hypothetical protein